MIRHLVQPIGIAAMSEPLTYTVEEAAELLGIGRNTCYEAVKRGEIPSIRIGGRILVPREALHQFLKVT